MPIGFLITGQHGHQDRNIQNRSTYYYKVKQKKDETELISDITEIKPQLVKQAFITVKGNLSDIHIFHTDRGNEFKNKTIEELLETFDMQRSLSRKGCPYDNVVAEATRLFQVLCKLKKTDIRFVDSY